MAYRSWRRRQGRSRRLAANQRRRRRQPGRRAGGDLFSRFSCPRSAALQALFDLFQGQGDDDRPAVRAKIGIGAGEQVPDQGAHLVGLQALVDLDGVVAGQGGQQAFSSPAACPRRFPAAGLAQGGAHAIADAPFAQKLREGLDLDGRAAQAPDVEAGPSGRIPSWLRPAPPARPATVPAAGGTGPGPQARRRTDSRPAGARTAPFPGRCAGR